MGRRHSPWLEGEPLSLVIAMATGSSHCRKTQGVPWQSILERTLTSLPFPPRRWVGLRTVRELVAMVMISAGADVTWSGQTQVWADGTGPQVWRVSLVRV